MEFVVRDIIEPFILPPGLFFVLFLFGKIIQQRFHRSGKFITFSAITLFVLVSIPMFSNFLLYQYETRPALDAAALTQTPARAIVILGGGRYPDTPEYQGDTVSVATLERIRYGAWLQRKHKLPILVTGGVVYGDGRIAEGVLMQQVLEQAFLAIVPWIENESRNTYENALFTKQLLEKENITNIILVTHALHMPRSIEAFEKVGFTVTPAPMGYLSHENAPRLKRFLPDIHSLSNIHDLMRELIGRVWYKLRYY